MSNPVSQLDYLKMTGWQKFCYRFLEFFRRLPIVFVNFFKVTIPSFAKRFWNNLKGCGITVGRAAKYGDWKTRLSFVLFGFSQLARKQWLRGLLFLFFEIIFIVYMALFGGQYLGLLGSLGRLEMGEYEDEFGKI